jgi:cytochrome c-type biogenesis protein
MTPLDPFILAPAAFLAGILMFLAPCTLPLVPGYLAFIAGAQKRVMPNAIAFVLGFAIIFILLGAFAGAVGALIAPWRSILVMAGGAIIILFGLVLFGVKIPILSEQKNIKTPLWLMVGHPASSFLLGALFALGWSPCIGPILGTVLLFAGTSSTALQGAVLLGVFAGGLGIPFLLTALLFEQAQKSFARWSAVAGALSKAGGLVLVVLGTLMLIGRMDLLVIWGFSFFNSFYTALLEYM